MRIIFAGTSEFAVPSLKVLAVVRTHQILCVITQPDRRKGRGLKQVFSPVKQLAQVYNLKAFQPELINESEVVNTLREYAPDLIVVVAYGQKISKEVLSLPAQGCINLHASLLPAYRGAAPINYALLDGDKETGVTIFKIVEKMDAGPIIAQASLAIKENETAGELESRLAQLGARLLIETLDKIVKGEVQPVEQDESRVSLAPKLNKESGRIKWAESSQRINNLVRAMLPWPGAHTFFTQPNKKQAVKIDIIQTTPTNKIPESDMVPGTIMDLKNGLEVSCEKETLIINKLKPADRRVITAQEFINGYRIKPGDRFE